MHGLKANAAFFDAWRAGKGDVGRLDRQTPLKIENAPIRSIDLVGVQLSPSGMSLWRRPARAGWFGSGGDIPSSGDGDIGLRATSTGRRPRNLGTFVFELQDSRSHTVA